MQQTPTRGQIALVLLLGILWGLNWPAVKIALSEIGPWTLGASALSVASIALVTFTVARGGVLQVEADRLAHEHLERHLIDGRPAALGMDERVNVRSHVVDHP
jgi:drug/metabolite transporter (DMT)-like permease